MFSFFKKKSQPAPVPTNSRSKIPTRSIYTDKFGNVWREYVNPLTIPAIRAISAEVATRYAEMKLTKDSLKSLMTEIKRAGNNGDFIRAFAVIDEIDMRLETIAEEKTLLELAHCYFLMGDEDETQINEGDRIRKMEVFESDVDARGFFLEKSFQYTIQYSDMSDTIITDYLKENRVNMEKINRFLRPKLSGNTSKKSAI